MKYNRKLGLEHLEDRTVPAVLLQLDGGGNLTAILGVPAGDLTLTQTSSNEINVVENGNDLGTYSVAGNLNVSLGNTTASLTHTLDLGGNTFSGSISMAFANSTGFTVINVAGPGIIEGNLTITQGTGSSSTNITDATIEGSVLVDPTYDSDGVSFSGVTIGGNLTSGNSGLFFDGASSVGGNFRFSGARDNLGVGAFLDAGSSIGGSVYFTGSRFGDSLNLAGSVGGNVFFTGLGGGNVLVIGDTATVLGSLTATGGNSFDTVVIDVGATIGGNVTLSLGNGPNVSVLNGTVLGRSINVVGGSGADVVTADTLTAPGARFSFSGRGGVDTLNFDATASVVASLLFDGGTGVDAFNVTGVIAFPTILRNVP